MSGNSTVSYEPNDIMVWFNSFPHFDAHLRRVSHVWNINVNSDASTPYVQSLFMFPVTIILIGMVFSSPFLLSTCFRTKIGIPTPKTEISRRYYMAAFLGCLFLCFLINAIVFMSCGTIISATGKIEKELDFSTNQFADIIESEKQLLSASEIAMKSWERSLVDCSSAISLQEPLQLFMDNIRICDELIGPEHALVHDIAYGMYEHTARFLAQQSWSFCLASIVITCSLSVTYFKGNRLITKAALMLLSWFMAAVVILLGGLTTATMAVSDGCMVPLRLILSFQENPSEMLEESTRYWVTCEGKSPGLEAIGK